MVAAIREDILKSIIDTIPAKRLGEAKEIAEIKMPDLNANDVDAAMRMVEGTARSMGVTVED